MIRFQSCKIVNSKYYSQPCLLRIHYRSHNDTLFRKIHEKKYDYNRRKRNHQGWRRLFVTETDSPNIGLDWLGFGLGIGVGCILTWITVATSVWFYESSYGVPIITMVNNEEKDKKEAEKKGDKSLKDKLLSLDWVKESITLENAIGIIHIVGSLSLVGVTFILLRHRAKKQWTRRQFLSRVGFSYHYIDKWNNQLAVRTLIERDLSHILLGNTSAISLVLKAANKVSIDQPFLTFSSRDGWVIKNSVLNEISTINPKGFLMANHESTIHKWFVFGITCEKDPLITQQKLRVILIEENDLKLIGDKEHFEKIIADNIFLKIRMKTLKTMYEEFKKCDFNKDSERLGKVELVLPK